MKKMINYLLMFQMELVLATLQEKKENNRNTKTIRLLLFANAYLRNLE